MIAKHTHDGLACMSVAGTKIHVAGNGYCWLISFLAAFGIIERPSFLTQQDTKLINMVVSKLQAFFEAEANVGRKWATQFDVEMKKKIQGLPQLRAGASPKEVLSR